MCFNSHIFVHCSVLVDLEGAVESGALNGVLGMRSDGTFDLDDGIPEMGNEEEDVQNKENVNGEANAKKKKMLRKLAGIIEELPNRQKRLIEMNNKAQAEKMKSVESEKLAVGVPSGGGGNRKKKGKKKK